jgi:hypothetical protein
MGGPGSGRKKGGSKKKYDPSDHLPSDLVAKRRNKAGYKKIGAHSYPSSSSFGSGKIGR